MKQMTKWMGCLFGAGLVAVASAVEDGKDEWGFPESWFTPTEAEMPADGDWSFEGDAFGAKGEATPPEPVPEDYRAECLERTQRFADLIATADSLLVKDFRLGVSPLDGDYETSDPAEIAEFNGLFRFVPIDGPGGMHLCAGHPEVTWRRGGEVVARITVGHGESIRWDGFGYWLGDVPLARESTLRLAEWFQRRGFHIAEEWHLGASRATENAGGLGPASIEVQIRGDVVRPGNYTVEEGFSLGGLLDMAEPMPREDPWLRPDLRHVMLWRDVDGQRKEMRLNCTDGMPGRDFLLQDGDEVLVTHPF